MNPLTKQYTTASPFQSISTFVEKYSLQNLIRIISEYKQPAINVSWIVLGLITIQIVMAILNAISSIPLMSDLLELVGLGYTIWFTIRYLLKAETREEILDLYKFIKEEVTGK